MIIAHISDTHIALDTPDADRRIADFERTIAQINADDPAPDAIFHTGDIVHNGRPDEYAEAARILAGARAPVYVIPGNKDDRAHLRAAFATHAYLRPDGGCIDYAIEDFPIRLIGVDTLCAGSNRGDFGPDRAERLVRLIDPDPARWTAVFTHHPPFEVMEGPDRLHFKTPQAMTRLADVLQQSGRVIAVFCGHVHRGVAGRVGPIPALIVPSIATTLRKGEYPARMTTRPVYHIHRFGPAGVFSTEARIVGAGA